MNYKIDNSHSEIGFKVRHLGISSVKGTFERFDSQINGDLNDGADIDVTIQTSSINTREDKRDGHLMGEDFFNSMEYPEMTFSARNYKMGDEVMNGTLTIKGVSKEIQMDVEYMGSQKDPYGNTVHGFEMNGVVYRDDYGLTWNVALDGGNLLLSNEVKLNLDIQVQEVMVEETVEV